MATLPQPDYYEVLGVPQTATEEQVKAAFQKLVTDFHAAGKPKNIDDVEWLRRVVCAFHALSDGSNAGPKFGYNFEQIENMSRSVDNEVALGRSIMLGSVLGIELRNFIGTILR
ncbi:MAG TPA: DnaJ domain-containing protein [Verrucomicrobiae bacterium]|nr:DnaJ domain-containing protein [Verrucomicrobiae bacterium]